MSKNRNQNKTPFIQDGFKGVEIQSNEPLKSSVIINPFTIVGDCKPSKTGRSLAMRIRCSDGMIHDYTIAKSELERIFLHNFDELTNYDGKFIPAEIREYHNSQD